LRSAVRSTLAVVSVVLWVVVAYLLLLEAKTALDGSETEHSPWAVARVAAPLAVVATAGWYAARRRTGVARGPRSRRG
jgi:hypothetical protein